MALRDSFPFERLPAELRVQVYELLYLCEFPLYIIWSRARKQIAGVTYPCEHGNKSGERAAYLDKHGAALLRTKKAIHNEALPMLYARNAFIFPEKFAFQEFADTAESGVPLIRAVTFRMISPKFYAHPTSYLDVFTGIRSFEWTLRDLIGSRSYPSFLAKRLLEPARDFVCFGTSAVSRRARLGMIRFVTRMRVTPQQHGRPGYDSVEEVLQAIKDELEKLLVKKGLHTRILHSSTNMLTGSKTKMDRRKSAKPLSQIEQPQSVHQDKPFPFEKLPAELRNAVYLAYFVRTKPVAIARRKCPMIQTQKTFTVTLADGSTRTRTVTIKTSIDAQLNSGELGTPGLAGPKCIKILGTNGASILRSNETISKEAISILYGQNKFSLNSLSVLEEFIKMIGDKIKFLRHCKLDYINGYHQKNGVNVLAAAENLQVLEIHVGVSTYCKNLDKVCGEHGRVIDPVLAFVLQGKTDVQRQDQFQRLRLVIDAKRYRKNEQGLIDHEGQEIKNPKIAEETIRAEVKKRLITRGLLKQGTDKS
ncbi:hypothetical protein LTR81_000245 [Elasticomyces elasticus]